MGTKFVAIHKSAGGEITHLRTNDGQVVTLREAQAMARRGEVDSLTDLHADGSWEIEHTAGQDGCVEGTNLDQLPEF